MKLPTKVKVGRTTYKVEVVEHYGDRCAAWRPIEKKILIARTSKIMRRKYTQKEQEEAFWHELTHAILWDMNRTKLNSDEVFVDGFAQRLTNAIRSAKFDEVTEFDVEKWKRENL